MLQFDTVVDVSKALDKYIDSLSEMVFFNIETTGLHHKYSYLYMIGILSQNNGVWTLHQWFATKPTDEPIILKSFMEFIKPNDYLIHYNGGSFALPYLMSRCALYDIPTKQLDNINSMDLYRLIRPYQKKLGLEKLTQKSVEQFIGIKRIDQYNGKELIEVYKKYLQSADQNLLAKLLLHNQEDVKNMASLVSLIAYSFLFDGHYTIKDVDLIPNALVINLSLEYPVIHPLTYTDELYTLSLKRDTATITVPLYHGTLKHYYRNPKDYYYLPAEDKAIHKSVAAYVDKEHRIPATAANCYQKMTGTFIPQYNRAITPAFSTERKTKITYFACDNLDVPDIEEWRPYINHLLQS